MGGIEGKKEPKQEKWRTVKLSSSVLSRIEKLLDAQYPESRGLRKPALGAYIEAMILPAIEEQESHQFAEKKKNPGISEVGV